ncbi:MAG: 50S ribosomal protein L5 [Candidatus Nealsonbacteria bacterium]|nr:50S ribosomal protein L5 [Candidatus Nealsonbacteria bacterium]
MKHLPEKYSKEAVPAMMKQFGYDNKAAVPKIDKVVVNMGIGKMIAGKSSNEEKKVIESAMDAFTQITGQRPVITKARKSISGFKLREGSPAGVKVTLRGKRMYDFLERLIHIALPRSRDFEGIKKSSFDKYGNLTIPLKEHIAFPEILPEEAKKIFSLEITIVTTIDEKEEGIALLKLLGFPIKE